MTRRSTRTRLFVILTFVLFLAGGAYLFWHRPVPPAEPPNVLNDAGRLSRTTVRRVFRAAGIEGLRQAVSQAAARHLKVSIAGKRHSMGGHTLYPDAVVLDMASFNRVVALDTQRRLVTVQSGITWQDLQEYLNPHRLAIIAMQGPNIFTVGGSMSVNAHGWDIRHGPVAETVEWFTLLLADGTIRRCSRTENRDLFRLVLGGYGLFGVILEVGLRITDNGIYTVAVSILDYKDYPRFFAREVLANPAVDLAYADLSVSPGSFLQEVVAVQYRRLAGPPAAPVALSEEHHVARDRFFLDLSRRFDWGKRLRWYMQNRVSQEYRPEGSLLTRNNIMRSSAVRRLEYYAAGDTDILQEYFLPRDRFVAFTDALRDVLRHYRANLLNLTVRYIKPNEDPFLNYARRESFAFVLYLNIPTAAAGQATTARMTRELIDRATAMGGTFYLPYLLNYDKVRLRQAYPRIDAFFRRKRQYDPQQRFMNRFYAKYAAE